MKVKEIVLSAAESLGLGEGVSAFFDGGDPCLQREAELLLACFNRVERSLALEYLPLYAEDELLDLRARPHFRGGKRSGRIRSV